MYMEEQPNRAGITSYAMVCSYDDDRDQFVATAPAWKGYEGSGDTADEAIKELAEQIVAVTEDASLAGLPEMLPDNDVELLTAPEMISRFRGLLDDADRAGAAGDLLAFRKSIDMLAGNSTMYSDTVGHNIDVLDPEDAREALLRQYRKSYAEQLANFTNPLEQFMRRYFRPRGR